MSTRESILRYFHITNRLRKSVATFEEIDNNIELQIKLFLYVTYDFEMELLSYGEYVKVLKPASLIEAVQNRYSKALSVYNSKV